jgi:hypothetical protein
MLLSLLFWIIMLLWLVLGAVQHRTKGSEGTTRDWTLGLELIPWIVIAALGWAVFGPAIKV